MRGRQRPSRTWYRLTVAIASVATAFLLLACTRGDAPPRPNEDLKASIVGVVASADPLTLTSGSSFPPSGGHADRITNWPNDPAFEEPDARPETLLLGGQRANSSWWYELVGTGGPNPDGCWPLYGGSFDQGDSIQFSSGLRVPKASTFEIRLHGQAGLQPFPGHRNDFVCLDETGAALYFDLFVGR